jgi:hypothetical protein
MPVLSLHSSPVTMLSLESSAIGYTANDTFPCGRAALEVIEVNIDGPLRRLNLS